MSSGKFISRFKQRFDHPQNIVRFLGPIIFFAGLVLLYGYRILELRNQICLYDWDLFISYHQN